MNYEAETEKNDASKIETSGNRTRVSNVEIRKPCHSSERT